MRKIFNKLASALCLGAITAAAIFQSFSNGLPVYAYSFVGQDSVVTTDLKVDGVSTGVEHTRIHLGSGGSSGYGSYRYINIVQGNIKSNPKISIEVLNHGTGIQGSAPLTSVVPSFNEDNQKVIAAVNGDWMNDTKSDIGISTTKSYRVSFSAMLSDGEIWCSQMSKQELDADYYTFGVTSDDEVVIGKLNINTTISNTTKGKTISADGINRAPASNAIYVYNDRLGSSNYVPTDAYEVIIDTTTSNKFQNGGTVSGKVVGIYQSGTTSRAGLSNGRVVITARGSSKISVLKSNFSIGDTVNISTTLYDSAGNNHLWAKCTEAIGGQSLVMKNGAINNDLAVKTSQYPTNIIGYKADGTVMMAMVTADSNGSYVGLQFNKIPQFCKEIGFDTCLLLDGGGSTTMVTVDGNSYVERACYSDGKIRSTWNSVAFVYKNMLEQTVYDAEYYRTMHGDLNAAFPNNETGLRNHFINTGIKEGRQASPIFDIKYYVENNADIKNTYGTDYSSALQHFYRAGYSETRYTAKCEDLGTDFYAKMTLSYSSNLAVGISSLDNVQTVLKDDSSAIWKFIRDTDGAYIIVNPSSGKVLDVSAASYSAGANILIYESNDTAAQRWFIFKNTNGAYTLRAKCAPSCVMDVSNAATTAGANIQSYSFNSSAAQKFNIEILFSQSECNFEVKASSGYTLSSTSDSDVAVLGISAGTTVSEFLNQFNHDIVVYNGQAKVVDTEKLRSGYTVKKIVSGAEVASAQIIVKGDYNGDGVTGAKDIIRMKKQISNGNVSGYCMAVDFDNDGKITIADLKAMANIVK